MAALSPSWAPEMTSLIPRKPRRARLFRNVDQNVSASEGPMCSPRISRLPSVLTATAIIAAVQDRIGDGGMAFGDFKPAQPSPNIPSSPACLPAEAAPPARGGRIDDNSSDLSPGAG